MRASQSNSVLGSSPGPSGGGERSHAVAVTAPRGAAAAMSAPHRFIALDSLRGVAALGVMLHHLPARNGLAALPLAQMGSLFVDFFFVLSGFVIACSYGDKLAAGFPLRRFAVLRLGRVVPVHLLMIALFLVMELLAWALGAGGLSLRPAFTGSHSPGHLFSATFLLDGYVPHRQNSYNGVSWSISVELFLYVLAALAYRLRGGMVLLYGAGLAALVLHTFWISWPILTTDLQRGLTGFAAGTACWQLFRRRDSSGLPAASMLEAISLAALFLFIWFSSSISHPELIFVPAAAVVWVFAHQAGALSRILDRRGWVWLGAISYSLYMTHVMVLGRAADALLLASRLTGQRLASYSWAGDLPIKNIELPLLPALLVQGAIIALALVVAHWCWRLVEEPARHASRRYAATL
jgi:peptidoglycan/LPS O-acetylase OafA/YrhL